MTTKLALPARPSAVATIQPAMLFLIAASFGLQPISTDLYLASLPALAEHFATDAAGVQLTLSVFIAGFAGAQLVAGPLSDRFGRLPVILIGLGLYVIASLAGLFAPTLTTLVAARFVQALGVCCANVCARTLVRDLYEGEAGARVMARALSWMSLVPLAGPVAGGFLVDAYGWRACFAAMTVASAVLLLAAALLLPETNRHRDPHALHAGPLVRNYLSILRSRSFRAYGLTVGASYGVLFSFISGVSFVMIQVLDVPVKWFGFTFSFASLGFLSGTVIVRRTLRRHGMVASAIAGGTLLAAGGAAMLALAAAGVQTVPAVLGPAFVMLMGHGMIQPTCQMGAIAPFPRSAGAAAAVVGFLMHLAAAFIGAWIGRSHDGTTLPLAATMAALGLLALASAVGLVRPAERERADLERGARDRFAPRGP